MNTALNRLIDSIFNMLDLFRFWYILDEFERGVVLRLGKRNRNIGAGLHFKIPFKIEKVMKVNVRKQTSASWDMTQSMLDGKAVTLSCGMIYEVINPTLVLLELDDWKSVASTIGKITVSRNIAGVDGDVIFSSEFNDVIQDKLNIELNKVGLNAISFGFEDLVRTRAYKFFRGAG